MNDESPITPKMQEKRDQILQQSLKVFAKEGYGGTDVQVIADRASVGKGTVYRHFGSKDQLFLATAKWCLDRMSEFINQRVTEGRDDAELLEQVGTVELLRRIGRAYAEFHAQNPEAMEIMIQERAQFRDTVVPSHLMHRAETRLAFDQFLQDAMDRGELRELDPTEATNIFADLLYGTVVNGCLSGNQAQLVQRVEQAIELFLFGLVVDKKSLRKLAQFEN